MKLSQRARVMRKEIEEAIQCSRDNEGIGKYFHVPVYEVMAIREAAAADFEPTATAEAIASLELRRSTEKLFRKWERKHGFRKGAGEILLPAGYVPEARP